jgi:hypothetical protein
MFFFEKKNQKTSTHCELQQTGSSGTTAARNGKKFFASFFQKGSLSS